MDVSSLQTKFVTQDDLEEKRRKRQEEWEKVRTANDPIEAPEEAVDNRSLYERLQEQKQKKDDEYEEQYRLKNQVRGLDEDETNFLDFVADRQEELMKKREDEDKRVLNEYRSCYAALKNQTITVSEKSLTTKVAESRAKPEAKSNRKSQQALLGGAVKRKSLDKKEHTANAKLRKTDEEEKECLDENDHTDGKMNASTSRLQESDPPVTTGPRARIIGILPGLGAYSGSSDSVDSSDESTSNDEDGLGLLVTHKKCVHPHPREHGPAPAHAH